MDKATAHTLDLMEKDTAYTLDLMEKDKQIQDLKVVLDTAQAALRRAQAVIKSEEDIKHVFNPSAKWVLSYKL